MNDPSKTDIPAGLLSGRLEGISLPDLVWALCRRNKTGVLTVSHGARKTIYFEEGRIVFAVSADSEDRLGETFLRDGSITLDQLDAALAELHTGKRIGTLLVEAGSLTASELVRGVLAQVQSIVLDMFTWDEGEYHFKEGPLPTDEVIKLGMKTSELVLRGIRRIRSFGRIRRSVGPPRTVYGLARDWRQALEGIDLSEGDELLVARLEQSDESVDWLCREVFLSNFEIYQTLWGFKVLGVVQEREARIERTREAVYEGSFEQHSFADVLVRLCRMGESGVLYVTRGARERTFHIDNDRCIFATSNDIEDGLVSYLLQRGVISLRDREETAKRLLSNKRVGTILRELGVIDDRDLREMVRQQLSQIVFDTFRWEAGEYAFVPGALPSNEEITLDESIESLVSDGMRRIGAWRRVREGCGDLESRLNLTPGFLEVLDRMGGGPEEWQVVTALKLGNTPREVCRTSELDDFRVCQILWALRVLGAVEPSTEPAAETEQPSTAIAYPEQAEPRLTVDVEELDRPPADEPPPVAVDEGAGDAAVETVEPDESYRVAESTEVEQPVEPEEFDEPAGQPVSTARMQAEADGSDDDRRFEEDELELSARDVDSAEVVNVELRDSVDEPVEQPIAHTVEEPVEQPVEEPIAQTIDEGGSESFAIPISVSRDETQPIAVEQTEAATAQADLDVAVETESDNAVGSTEDWSFESESEPDREADEPEAVETLADDEESDEGRPSFVVDQVPGEAVSPDETQVISAEVVNAALKASTVEEPVEQQSEPEGDSETTTFQEADDATRTLRLSREQVEAALRGESELVSEPEEHELAAISEEPEESWEPPDDLDVSIARFNAVQRLLYRAVRSEVGAGASNFIRACCEQSTAEAVDPLARAQLQADGSWDADGLRQAVVEHRIEEPWVAYQRLIEREIDVLRGHIGEGKAAELERQIERIERAGVSG